MWVERLTADDYQTLLDRGWRRSGRYVYKPCMDQTCCPLYTIRCKAGEYQPTKSQRKVIKRVNNFVKNGTKSEKDEPEAVKNTEIKAAASSSNVDESKKSLEVKDEKLEEEGGKDTPATNNTGSSQFKRVEGLKKAKIIRREKYLEKMIKSGKEPMIADTLPKNKPKTISALVPDQNYFALNQTILQSEEDSSQRFMLRLVKADLKDRRFMSSFHESYQVYRRYQTVIHKDKPQDCDIQTFAGFLFNSPLIQNERYQRVRSFPPAIPGRRCHSSCRRGGHPAPCTLLSVPVL